MDSLDLNLNNSQCIQKVSHIGYNRVHNVCNGLYNDLPWGFEQWAEFVVGFSVIGFFVIMFLGIFLAFWASIRI